MIRHHRRGFTLVELLVTLAVISALAVIVLPSVKTMLADRRGSQAAIMVKNYLEAARSRAIASGRPVAVVLERLSSRPFDADENGRIEGAEVGVSGTASSVISDPLTNYIPYNSCIRLSMAESPMPISSVSVEYPKQIIASYSGNPPIAQISFPIVRLPFNPPNDPRFYRVAIYLQTYVTQSSVQDVPSRGFIEATFLQGTEVSFGLTETKHLIASVQPDVINGLAVLVVSIPSGNIAFKPSEFVGSCLAPPSEADGFVVYPKPKPIAVQNVNLPRGICIDLSVSGFSEPRKTVHLLPNLNFEADLPAIATWRDYRVRLSSTWISPIQTSVDNATQTVLTSSLLPVPLPQNLRPVYIVFNPDGSFGRIYANGPRVQSTVTPFTSLQLSDASEDLFLHIGRIDQVSLIAKQTNRSTGNSVVFPATLDDPSNYIVRISPKSGAVAASPIGAIRDEDFAIGGLLGESPSLGDCVSLSRKRAFAQFATGQ